jgi:hypothetical protein
VAVKVQQQDRSVLNPVVGEENWTPSWRFKGRLGRKFPGWAAGEETRVVHDQGDRKVGGDREPGG